MRSRARGGARVIAALLLAATGIAMVLFPLRTRAVAKDRGGDAVERTAPGAGTSPSSADAESPVARSTEQHDPPSISESSSPDGVAVGKGLPIGKGLPVEVHAAVFFLQVKSFDDTRGEVDCTTDLRLRWTDLRHAFPPSQSFRGYKEWRGKAAEKKLATMWQPQVDVTNRLESGSYVGRRLRIFSDGRIETITRQTGKHSVEVDASRFPFDRQYLALDMLVREETTDEVLLRFDFDDVEWSRAASDAKLDGWTMGLVDLDAAIVPGWNGDRYARVTAALIIDRDPSTGLAPIFIPLVASLLIPLLAIWMNKATDDGYEVEAFELANMGIGGLFSVIALSFAIYTSYGMVAGRDNTVTRLFGLNYATLAISLAIVVMFFRYNLARRWFGKYVHMEVFKLISWALPVLTLGTSLAFVLAAYV